MTINYNTIADSLASEGYIVLPNFLSDDLTEQLYQNVSKLPEEQFKQAGIGRNNDLQINQQIRGDLTHWLSGETACERNYLAAMDELRLELNSKLFLGLFDYESHYSHYKSGSYYQRHVDAFEGRSNRIVTTVFYLNHNWTADNGGELILYQNNTNNVLQHISPSFGTMVIFLSERSPHEVLSANRDRYSIAGWFRIDRPV